MEPQTELNSKRGGVADYFAVVGVGEKLIWKHTQKKGIFGTEIQSDNEENESDLLERFHREIVDVCIVANSNNDSATSFLSRAQSSVDEASISSTNTPVKHSSADDQIPVQTSELHARENSNFPHNKYDFKDYTTIHSTCPTARIPRKDQLPSSSNGTNESRSALITKESFIWEKSQVFDANLDPFSAFRRDLFSRLSSRDSERSFKDIGRKVGNKLRNQLVPLLSARGCGPGRGSTGFNFHIAYRRRAPDENDRPAIADIDIRYVRLHRDTLFITRRQGKDEKSDASQAKKTALERGIATGATVAARVAEVGKQKFLEKYRERYETGKTGTTAQSNMCKEIKSEEKAGTILVAVEDVISIPEKFDYLSIPDAFRWIKISSKFRDSIKSSTTEGQQRAIIFPCKEAGDSQDMGNFLNDEATNLSEPSGTGFEAYYDGSTFVLTQSSSTLCTPDANQVKSSEMTTIIQTAMNDNKEITTCFEVVDPAVFMPKLIESIDLPYLPDIPATDPYVYIPIIAFRHQRIGEEERYHEDPALVDLVVTLSSLDGSPSFPDEDAEDEDDFNLFSTSSWSCNGGPELSIQNDVHTNQNFGLPILFFKRNIPIGFADATFATQVLDRFPFKNYKGLPLPEEELPMFCYPTGCRLLRARFSDCPLPQYFGFVVKVCCLLIDLSFLLQILKAKLSQLRMSEETVFMFLVFRLWSHSLKTKLRS